MRMRPADAGLEGGHSLDWAAATTTAVTIWTAASTNPTW